MEGAVSGEYEMKVDSSKVWELYRSLELAKLVEQGLPLIHKVEVVQGDGGLGTVFNLIFAPGIFHLLSYVLLLPSYVSFSPSQNSCPPPLFF